MSSFDSLSYMSGESTGLEDSRRRCHDIPPHSCVHVTPPSRGTTRGRGGSQGGVLNHPQGPLQFQREEASPQHPQGGGG